MEVLYEKLRDHMYIIFMTHCTIFIINITYFLGCCKKDLIKLHAKYEYNRKDNVFF